MYYYTPLDLFFSTSTQIILVGLLAVCLYVIGLSFIKQQELLKERNYMLAQMLQTAELQTGTPYYSSVAADATDYEYNRPFFTALQNRIKYPQPPAQEPVADDPGM